ncbi:MAG TPA: PQQ-dependent sugar dehydrogenase, partial [Nitrososphaeraceae archaeon]|nr:PQQ-dependent sugar dehydrogenase [Nitrososphaeraceae archaeon]
NVNGEDERGLLGIASSNNSTTGKIYVFLYYTEAEPGTQAEEGEDSDNEAEEQTSNGDGGQPIGNRLYRYELSENGSKLVNPKLLLDLPYQPGPAHNGGAIALGGPNNSNVCVIIGNLEVPPLNEGKGTNIAQNIPAGEKPDGRAGINCVTQNGEKIKMDTSDGGDRGILGVGHPLDKYYAYGIRNGFGIAFDPLSGLLWDTENGGYDEINLVEPGSNSGFSVITGSSNRSEYEDFRQEDLVNFDGNGKYSDPELDLGKHIAPTALAFLNSKSLGEEHENELFVATVNGKIFHFALSDDRRQLALEGKLTDKIADSEQELEDVTFGDDMGLITDLEVGPDGYLYATIFNSDDGKIVRILPKNL